MSRNNKKSAEDNKSAKIGPEMDFASAEAYNLLRTNIAFSLPDKEGSRVIGVTSPCPREGKSTTSENLAYSLAAAGHKVILVDADMRRATIADTLHIPASPGLSNYLSEQAEGTVRKGVLHEKMDVIPAGDMPPNPSELIGSERMRQLIERLRGEYDYVIVDLPPVKAVADPIAASKFIDGMIIVVRHERSRRREVTDAIRQLKMVDAKLLGFVYNGVFKGKSRYYKKYY